MYARGKTASMWRMSDPIQRFSGAFRTSTKLALQSHYDEGKHNPLQFLHPCEKLAAEIFVGVHNDPASRVTYPKGKERTWSGLLSGAFGSRWKESCGYDLTPSNRKRLESNPAWRHYVRMLMEEQTSVVKQKLRDDALDAYDTFKWSRETARRQGDYKEARLAASDHLDRIGATEKPREIAPNVVVVLQSGSTPETIFAQPIEAEVIEMLPPGDDVSPTSRGGEASFPTP